MTAAAPIRPTVGRPAPEGRRATTRESALDRARRRRQQRTRQMSGERLGGAGRPIRAALMRVPFVIILIAILAGGVTTVLFVNTKTDESGMRTERARSASSELRLQIEALNRDIATASATPNIAERARALGLVPAGDAAMLVIDKAGRATLLGTPKPIDANQAAVAGQGGHR